MPGVLGGLANARAVNHGAALAIILIHVLPIDVSLNLILAEPKRKVQFEGLIILPRLWLLKARLVGVCSSAGSAIGGAPWILRPMVVR